MSLLVAPCCLVALVRELMAKISPVALVPPTESGPRGRHPTLNHAGSRWCRASPPLHARCRVDLGGGRLAAERIFGAGGPGGWSQGQRLLVRSNSATCVPRFRFW